MRKVISAIKENWKDPVWSKVIATGIITVAGFVLTSLYALIKMLSTNVSFGELFQNIWTFLNEDFTFKIWLFIILIILYVILIFKPLVVLVNNILFKFKSKKGKEKSKNNDTPKSKIATEHSTSFFFQRMASAFPGIRDVTWFENSKDATRRLEILLQKPLRFVSENCEFESTPIWWFRGGSALFIERFKKIGRRKILMNIDQMKIKRIAAFHGKEYYKDFVYVEIEKEEPTGLYKYTDGDIQQHIETFGYSWEEYGLIKNWLGWKKFIRREDYDDGATVIKGKVKDVSAELRARYLTQYNFIIAAKDSPYNSDKFNNSSESFLNGILTNKIEPNDFFDFLKSFNKHER